MTERPKIATPSQRVSSVLRHEMLNLQNNRLGYDINIKKRLSD